MKKWGAYLFFFGVGSIALYFLHMEFVILSWIDHWGTNVGWAIRIGMAVIGGIMWLVAKPEMASDSSSA
ncbi:MAG TPA: hypothetical protein VKA50_12690 [Gammaproteobacteria bacterium]|nr:hypothetical protein [Gammaproteobacteria bacterium]